MDVEDDDLPAGYPNVWGRVLSNLRWWRMRGKGARAARVPLKTTAVQRADVASRQQRFFQKLGPTEDWRENRRIYNQQYEQRKRKR